MRGLEKPSPPSNVSPDGQVPRGLVDAEGEYLATLPSRTNKAKFAKATFDGLDKARLRDVLYGEQKSLCVYCERTISESDPSPHVEHWRLRSRAPEYALHWRNLYLSCSTGDTCGVRKDHRPLKADDGDPDLPWPTELVYEELVGFTSRGEMYVRDDVHMDGATRSALTLAIDDDRQEGGRPRRAILISITRLSWRLAVRRWTANRCDGGGTSSRGRHRVRSGPRAPTVCSAAVSFLRS